MAWAHKPAPAKHLEPNPIWVGLDLNATRARAVHGPAHMVPCSLPLDGAREDLAMVLSLEKRHPEVGHAGSSLCRQSPHLVCNDFLASLGEPRQWAIGRHRLDATKALTLVLQRFGTALAGVQGLAVAVPAYLTRAQVLLLNSLSEKARLPLLGSVRTPLACGLAAYESEPWSGLALVLDADDHALTATTVVADGDQLWVHASQSWQHLNLRTWKGRLLDRVADRCVRQSRRDPRDSAPAEQSLYEQIEDALDACGQGKPVEFLIQTPQWYQNLLVRAEEIVSICDRLVLHVVAGVRSMLTATTARRVLVTQSAGRLPGLITALQHCFGEAGSAQAPEPSVEDFGEGLIQDVVAGPTRVTILLPDAVARAAHDLAGYFYRGELPRGHLDLSVPLPKSDTPPAVSTMNKRAFRLLSPEGE